MYGSLQDRKEFALQELSHLFVFAKSKNVLQLADIIRIINVEINKIVNKLPKNQQMAFKKEIQQARQKVPTLKKTIKISNITFHLMPSWGQTGAECGMRAINNASLLFKYCTKKAKIKDDQKLKKLFAQLQQDLLNKLNLGFNPNQLNKALTACGNITGQSLEAIQIVTIGKLSIPAPQLIVIGNFRDVINDFTRLGSENITKLTDAVRTLQTQTNGVFAFLFNTAGYKSPQAIATEKARYPDRDVQHTTFGHWTTIVVCKKNNTITAYVADSIGLYLPNGSIKPDLLAQMNWLAQQIKQSR